MISLVHHFILYPSTYPAFPVTPSSELLSLLPGSLYVANAVSCFELAISGVLAILARVHICYFFYS